MFVAHVSTTAVTINYLTNHIHVVVLLLHHRIKVTSFFILVREVQIVY